MNVFFITQFFPGSSVSGQTGGTISNSNLVRTLAQHNDVTVLSFDRSSSADAFHNEPYRVIHRPAPPWRAPALFLRWQQFVKDETERLLHQVGSPELLVATTSSLAALAVAPLGCRKAALVRAYENFGFSCPWVAFRARIPLAKLAVVRRFQDARHMRMADAVLTNSGFMRKAIASRFRLDPVRIDVLLQQSDVEPGSAPPVPASVGFVHRGSEKNIAFVLKLAQRAPELTFHIYGHAAGLPASVPGNVRLEGWYADRGQMFGSAAVWIVPSLWAEPFGRVSIEAQAMNRPVLVADRGGLPETVFDERFRIAGFDAEQWRDRLHRLMQIPPTELASNGERIRQMYSAAAHDERIREVFARILSV